MKKLFCLLAALLLLVSMTAFAGAEGAYEMLSGFIATPDVMGPPDITVDNAETFEINGSDKWCMVNIRYTDEHQYLALQGINASGEPEISMWSYIELHEALGNMLGLCQQWSVIEESLDPGYSLIIILSLGDSDDDILIVSDAETAALVAETIEGAL